MGVLPSSLRLAVLAVVLAQQEAGERELTPAGDRSDLSQKEGVMLGPRRLGPRNLNGSIAARRYALLRGRETPERIGGGSGWGARAEGYVERRGEAGRQ